MKRIIAALGLGLTLAGCASPVGRQLVRQLAPDANCVGRAELLSAPALAGSTVADALSRVRGAWLVRADAPALLPYAAPVRVYANGQRLAGDLDALTTVDTRSVAALCWLSGSAASAKYGSENERGAFDITWWRRR